MRYLNGPPHVSVTMRAKIRLAPLPAPVRPLGSWRTASAAVAKRGVCCAAFVHTRRNSGKDGASSQPRFETDVSKSPCTPIKRHTAVPHSCVLFACGSAYSRSLRLSKKPFTAIVVVGENAETWHP
jgi:hypothetical protein